MTTAASTPSLLNRISRALRLDVNLFEEVEADKKATAQAVAIVLVTTVIGAIAATTTAGIAGLLIGAALYLASFAVWALLNFWIGAKLFPEKDTKADWGELFRTMGFATSPRFFLIFILIPVPFLQAIIGIAVNVWTWIGMVIGVRSALDYKSTLRAAGVTFVGFVVNIFLAALFGILISRI